jgi:hypothetical protein
MVDPLAAWNFDETSGQVIDITGNGHDFTLAGSSQRTIDTAGYTLKGLTQTSFTSDLGPAIFGQTATRCIMTWVKFTGSVTSAWLLESKNAGLDTGVWGFFLNSGTIQLRAKDATNTPFGPSIAQPVDSTWHHLCGAYDGGALILYLDGVEVARQDFTGPIWTSATEFYVFEATGNVLTIDDVRIYDDPLDEFTISELMSIPVGQEPTSGAIYKIWNGTTWVDTTPVLLGS